MTQKQSLAESFVRSHVHACIYIYICKNSRTFRIWIQVTDSAYICDASELLIKALIFKTTNIIYCGRAYAVADETLH